MKYYYLTIFKKMTSSLKDTRLKTSVVIEQIEECSNNSKNSPNLFTNSECFRKLIRNSLWCETETEFLLKLVTYVISELDLFFQEMEVDPTLKTHFNFYTFLEFEIEIENCLFEFRYLFELLDERLMNDPDWASWRVPILENLFVLEHKHETIKTYTHKFDQAV